MGQDIYSEAAESAGQGQRGFSLIETAIAMVIIMVAVLGIFGTITYAINYNAGNNSRAQTLAVLQQEVERLRSLKFTPGQDQLPAGNTTQTIVVNNTTFNVRTIITNNDLVTPTLKDITVTASLSVLSPGWQTAVPATVELRRVRSN